MLRNNRVFQEDLHGILSVPFIPWEQLRDKSVFITGATGLIGYTLICALLQYNLSRQGNIRIAALVRDRKRAEEKFFDWFPDAENMLAFHVGTVEDLPEMADAVDYIVHCACPTSSAYFAECPVETIETIYAGTRRVLELAREKQVSGVVFLSSMEVYGEVKTRDKLRESDLGHIDIISPRSSYPEGKRMAENLCCAYAKEFGVPVTIARLAQTFGPGVDKNDGRVFAYMARCALEGRDIRLNTDGSKENMYLYTMDAVSAVLLLLARGERGAAYNAANEATYCAVREMAELVTSTFGKGVTGVKVNAGQAEEQQYRPAGYLNLDTSKLKALGWTPCVCLEDMYVRMMSAF